MVGAAMDAREVAPWRVISADRAAQQQGITPTALRHRAPFDALEERQAQNLRADRGSSANSALTGECLESPKRLGGSDD
jgi:hypothetical protein